MSFLVTLCYDISMMRRLFITLFALFLCLSFVPISHAQEVIKDSYYFMKDDNEFSAEEKDEEALYVFEKCSSNAFQNLYFDCSCIAGAYRQERDNGPIIPQNNLLNSLYTKKDRGCANTVGIAGDSYKFCKNFANAFRSRDTNNEPFCECVANDVAKNFSKKPYLDVRYFEDLKSDALFTCGKKFKSRS